MVRAKVVVRVRAGAAVRVRVGVRNRVRVFYGRGKLRGCSVLGLGFWKV